MFNSKEVPNTDQPNWYFPTQKISKKILCEAWALDSNGHRDKFIGSKRVKFGDKFFKLKVGKEKKFFWINYELIREGKKHFLYQCNIRYANVGLSNHEFPVERKLDSGQMEHMLKEKAVEVYVKHKGMPYWYLLIAMLMVVVMAGIVAYIAPEFQKLTTFHEADVKQLDKNRDTILSLRQQVEELGGTPRA